jgi:hypothetical protein
MQAPWRMTASPFAHAINGDRLDVVELDRDRVWATE